MTYPPSRAFRVRVTRVQRLSPHFVRFTLSGPDTEHVALYGPDQRIKLLLPFADGSETDFGLFADPRPAMTQWYAAWRALPDATRNPLRTYTLRAVRPELAELDIDFVLHGTEGPASAWAAGAVVGDELTIVAPDRRANAPSFGGVEWHPGTARQVLIAGDETAAPAICAILEELEEHITGHAFIEVPSREDILPVALRSGVRVQWLAREDRALGAPLTESVREWGRARAALHGASPEDVADDVLLWEVPDEVRGDEYAWLAGEAGVITGLRRHLVRDLGIDRKTVAFMGYWRAGRAEGG